VVNAMTGHHQGVISLLGPPSCHLTALAPCPHPFGRHVQGITSHQSLPMMGPMTLTTKGTITKHRRCKGRLHVNYTCMEHGMVVGTVGHLEGRPFTVTLAGPYPSGVAPRLPSCCGFKGEVGIATSPPSLHSLMVRTWGEC
jgi:hypothetical protein